MRKTKGYGGLKWKGSRQIKKMWRYIIAWFPEPDINGMDII